MPARCGTQTIVLGHHPAVIGFAAVGGKAEGEGPLHAYFDQIYTDDTLGQDSFEQAESLLQKEAILRALIRAQKQPKDVDVLLAGDLLAQCIGSTFAARTLQMPFLGVYGACSTMSLSLGLAGIFVDSGAAHTAVAATSSHFAAAERQFRLPLEYGGQRPPTAQRTATAAGATVVSENVSAAFPYLTGVTFGKIIDLGICDANNMGAAMAPAAADTVAAYLRDTKTVPQDYDLILTGDLGKVGSALFLDLLKTEHQLDVDAQHKDCGLLLYDCDNQDVHAGGSGCGCAASVLNGWILPRMQEGKLHNVLLTATGALMSPTSAMQGESIPAVAHTVAIRCDA